MSQWVRNEVMTRAMRQDPYCPTDACVYDKPPLRAFVMYADIEEPMPGLRWHIVLASAEGRPDLEQAFEAQEALLPGLRICVVPAPYVSDRSLHICELLGLRERRERGVLQ